MRAPHRILLCDYVAPPGCAGTPIPGIGGVTGPCSLHDRGRLPGQLAACTADVHPEPPSAAPSPGTWWPLAIWSRPRPQRRCSALALSSARPLLSVPGGCRGRNLLPRGQEGESCSAAVPSQPQPLPVLGEWVMVYSAAAMLAHPVPVFGCMGRDTWCPAPFSVSGWRGQRIGEGVSPDVPSQLEAKYPVPAAAVEQPGTAKAETRVHCSPAHPRTPQPWAHRATAMVPGALGCPQAATVVCQLPPSRVQALWPTLA